MLQDILEDQAVSDAALFTFAVLYSLVILGSVIGNILVITAVLKAPKMRKVSSKKQLQWCRYYESKKTNVVITYVCSTRYLLLFRCVVHVLQHEALL